MAHLMDTGSGRLDPPATGGVACPRTRRSEETPHAAASSRPPSPSACRRGSAARPPTVEKALPFIADDYAKALAEARAQKLPLFIEAWAPW